MNVLTVEGVGKSYRLWSSEWLRIASWFGLPVTATEEHWVLRNVSFSVDRGEAIGIVGPNGAGKSTLLKAVVGTIRPSEGEVTSVGRIAAILELGMGFNPDFTGRQNAYHTAGLMGFARDRVEAIMPEIESFAEIGEYFDEPMRTYSSGMQVRVAFSVATAFRPDLLIVDEALSVGDAYFQHKSFDRIRRFQREGTSLLIVSHDANAIQTLCTRAILLESGAVLRDGMPEDVMDFYNALIASRENSTVQELAHGSGRKQIVSGSGEAGVVSVRLYDGSGSPVEHIGVGAPVELRVEVLVHQAIPRLVLGYMIKDRLGQQIYGTNTHHTGQAVEDVLPGQKISFRIAFHANLGPGSYSVSTALVSTDTHLVNNYEWRDLALVFNVSNFQQPHFVGNNWMPPSIAIERT